MNKKYNAMILKIKYLFFNLSTLGLMTGVETIKVDYSKGDFRLIVDVDCLMLHYDLLDKDLPVDLCNLDSILNTFELLDFISLEVSLNNGFDNRLWKNIIKEHNINIKFVD